MRHVWITKRGKAYPYKGIMTTIKLSDKIRIKRKKTTDLLKKIVECKTKVERHEMSLELMENLQEIEFAYADLLLQRNDKTDSVVCDNNIKKLNKSIELHLIGGLQTNKAKDAVKLFDYIHSVDRESLVEALKIAEEKLNFKRKYFLQVNTGDEEQKFGTSIKDLDKLYDFAKDKINIVGLMCIPPIDQDHKKHFETLRELSGNLGIKELSMGMSDDYLDAGLLGATYVRIGSKIFGFRD